MPIVHETDAVRPLVLALDIGTSSVRALVFDARGWAVAGTECQIGYEMATTPDGGADVDADFLLDLVGRAIDGVLAAHRKEISAVGITTFWHSVMGIDRDERPTTPVYLWADTRSRDEVEAIRAEFNSAELWQRTGCFVHSSYWPGKLRWLAKSNPASYADSVRWCAFGDYLLYRLFGEWRTSVSMASSSAMLNATTLDWDDLAVHVAGVDRSTLVRVGECRERLDSLPEPWRNRWPALSRVPWFMAVGDGACANVGAGGVGPERIALTIGTSGALRMVGPHPRGATRAIPQSLWTYRLDDDRAVYGAAISNGGKVVEWLAELAGVGFDHPVMSEMATLEPDSHGLTILPFLAGERAPIWNDWATATISGLKLATTPAEIIRAGMESVTYRLCLIYDELRSLAAEEHQIVANGGAVLRSEVWLQMLADALGHEIVALPPDEESSARGAALMALEYAGFIESIAAADDPVSFGWVISPNEASGAVYRRAMERQERLLAAMYEGGRPIV